MTDITVKQILALIHRRSKWQTPSTKELEDILYINLSAGHSRFSEETVSFTTPDGSELYLDINKDGHVVGIEFY